MKKSLLNVLRREFEILEMTKMKVSILFWKSDDNLQQYEKQTRIVEKVMRTLD